MRLVQDKKESPSQDNQVEAFVTERQVVHGRVNDLKSLAQSIPMYLLV